MLKINNKHALLNFGWYRKININIQEFFHVEVLKKWVGVLFKLIVGNLIKK